MEPGRNARRIIIYAYIVEHETVEIITEYINNDCKLYRFVSVHGVMPFCCFEFKNGECFA